MVTKTFVMKDSFGSDKLISLMVDYNLKYSKYIYNIRCLSPCLKFGNNDFQIVIDELCSKLGVSFYTMEYSNEYFRFEYFVDEVVFEVIIRGVAVNVTKVSEPNEHGVRQVLW